MFIDALCERHDCGTARRQKRESLFLHRCRGETVQKQATQLANCFSYGKTFCRDLPGSEKQKDEKQN
jgi:hypothetical protein